MAMAAANQALPGLQVTAPDEDMEISDYERNADDIDIDIDLNVEPSHHEDENMADDRSENENRDDIMLDGDGNDEDDGMMQDNMSVPDEHLTDASEMGYIDIEVKEAPQDQEVTEHVDVEVQDRGQAEDYIDYDDAIEAQPKPVPELAAQQPGRLPVADQSQLLSGEEQNVQEQPAQAPSAEVAALPQPETQVQAAELVETRSQEPVPIQNVAEQPSAVEERQDTEKPLEPQVESVVDQPASETQDTNVTENVTHVAPEVPTSAIDNEERLAHKTQGTSDSNAEPNPEQQTTVSEQPAEPHEQAVDFSHLPFDPQDDDEHSSHPGFSFHPVVVVYQGDEISLFPPKDGDTSDAFYFLQDESLANESVQTLLHACRQILGDTVRAEDELELDIAELGLCLSEDSQHASGTSFAQILDVYVQLHQLDGVQNPGPLYMTLTTKTRFSNRLNALLEAIADGRGMSQLTFLEDVTEEEAYVESESVADQQISADTADGQRQQQTFNSAAADKVSEPGEATAEEQHGPTGAEEQAQGTAIVEHAQESHFEHEQTTISNEQQRHEAYETTQGSYDEEEVPAVSPPAEDLPEYESEDGDDIPREQEQEQNADNVSRGDAPRPEDSHEDNQIDYDDGDNADDAKDDASYRSSTLQGDNTPANLEDGTSQHGNNTGIALTDNLGGPTSITGAPQDESYYPDANEFPEQGAGEVYYQDEPSGEQAVDQATNLDTTTAERQNDGHAVIEQESNEAGAGLDQAQELELSNQGESFDLPHGYQNNGEEQYEENYEDGEDEYGYQPEGYTQETLVGEETTEEYVVVDTEDAQNAEDSAIVGPGGDDEQSYHDNGFDDAEAAEIAESFLDGTHSGLEKDLDQSADQEAQPSTHASEEDDLDTIDYDDEELSQPRSPQQDDAGTQGSVAPSPSSAKRGWDELGQDEEDETDSQAPKKVKSE